MQARIALLPTGLLLLASLTGLAGCQSGPQIRRDTSPTANFAAYHTFGFFKELATDRAGYETIFTARLKAAARRNMEAKGYVYSDTDPDLLVNFYANVEDKQEVRSTPLSIGYFGWRGAFGYGFSTSDVHTVNYKQGTVTIDVVDAHDKMLVWTATAEGRISPDAREHPGPAVDKTVDEMMAPMPGRSGK